VTLIFGPPCIADIYCCNGNAHQICLQRRIKTCIKRCGFAAHKRACLYLTS